MQPATSTASIRSSGRRLRRAKLQARSSSAGGSFRDVIGTVADRGNLTPRQIAAGDWLYGLLGAWGGTTGGMVGAYSERVDSSTSGSRAFPSGWTAEFLALEKVLDGMHGAERRLLQWLVTYAERPTGRRSLQYYVTDVLGLDVARQYAIPMAVGHIQALLEAVADLREHHTPAAQASALRRSMDAAGVKRRAKEEADALVNVPRSVA